MRRHPPPWVTTSVLWRWWSENFWRSRLQYPIFFSKEADTGRFYCGVMLGFDPNENLFLEEHRQRTLYRPLNLQRGPFYTAGPDLAVDLEHPRVAQSGDQVLFDERGEPSAYLKSIIGLMKDLKPGLEQTRLFIETLLGLAVDRAGDGQRHLRRRQPA